MQENSQKIVNDSKTCSWQIREMQEQDMERVAELAALSFSEPFSIKQFEEMLANFYYHIFVLENENIIGYAVVSWSAVDMDLESIAVEELNRGYGWGGKLLDACIAFAKDKKMEYMHLEVRSSNASAKKLYASRQFEPMRIRKNYYKNPSEDGEDLRLTL